MSLHDGEHRSCSFSVPGERRPRRPRRMQGATIPKIAIGVFLGLCAFWAVHAVIVERGGFTEAFLQASAYMASLPDRWPGARPQPASYRLKLGPVESEPRSRPHRPAVSDPFRSEAGSASVSRSEGVDPMAEWRRNREAVAGLRLQESECRYWRDQRGQVDPDTIAEQLIRNHCYPE
jgi:hypothetical protein